MVPVVIREAVSQDVPAILQLYAKAGIDGGISFTHEEARLRLAGFKRYPSYRVFVAMVEQTVVGTYELLVIDNLAKRGRKSAIVEDVAVDPSCQRQGIGRAMMEHAREQCRLADCYKLALSSHFAREDAHRFYESLGFERHGYSFRIEP
jgi:GNAT superfamily N-acetyltransferase